jgi:hypothetical protein
MYNKNDIDVQAEREGAALKQQGRDKQSRYRWIRLQAEHKVHIEKKYFKG